VNNNQLEHVNRNASYTANELANINTEMAQLESHNLDLQTNKPPKYLDQNTFNINKLRELEALKQKYSDFINNCKTASNE